MQIQLKNNQPNFGMGWNFNRNTFKKTSPENIINVNTLLRRNSDELDSITKGVFTDMFYTEKNGAPTIAISTHLAPENFTLKEFFKCFFQKKKPDNSKFIELKHLNEEKDDSKFLKLVEASVKTFKES